MTKQQSDHSKQRGVYKCGVKFKSQIQVDGKQEYLGIFDTREGAAQAYDIRALQFGRTDHLNYNSRGGNSLYRQDFSRIMQKRILGGTLLSLNTKRKQLVDVVIQLAYRENEISSGNHCLYGFTSNDYANHDAQKWF